MSRERRAARAGERPGRLHDPQGLEPAALRRAADLEGRRVLEIGCGDGRLTFRYRREVRLAVGIDPALGEIVTALGVRPAARRRRLGFAPACALALPFRSGEFDMALLAWSL